MEGTKIWKPMWAMFLLLLWTPTNDADFIYRGPVPEGSFVYQYGTRVCYISKQEVMSSTGDPPERCIVYNIAGSTVMGVRRYGQSLFLGDSGNFELERRLLDRNRQFIISYGSHNVQGLSVDWSSNTVYWTEFNSGTLLAAYTEGTEQLVTVVLTGLYSPTGLTIDPHPRYMYWGESGTKRRIMRAHTDGTNSHVFLGSEMVGDPGDLTMDLARGAERLFWIDLMESSIKSIKVDGTDLRKVIQRSNSLSLKGVTVSEFLVAWSEISRSNTPTNGSILWANKTDGAVIRELKERDSTSDVVYFGRYPANDDAIGLCSNNNGGCAHICLHTANHNKECKCSFGYQSTDRGQHCTADPGDQSPFLLVSDVGWWNVFQVPLHTSDSPSAATKIPQDATERPISAQYDWKNKSLFWIDRQRNVIKKSDLDGGNQHDIFAIPGGTQAQGMALDMAAQRVYVTDSGSDVIFSVSTEGTGYTNVTTTGLEKPRDIILDVKSKFIFWTDWGQHPKIERSDLPSGSNRITVADKMGAPNGLAADFDAGYLYWTDGLLSRIEKCRFDGSMREVLVNIPDSHLVGLALYGRYLYAADTLGRQLRRIDHTTGEQQRWGPSLFQIPFYVKVVSIPTIPEVTTMTTTVTTVAPPGNEEKAINLPVIIGACVGGLVFVILVIAIAVMCHRLRSAKKDQTTPGFENPAFSSTVSRAPDGSGSSQHGSVSGAGPYQLHGKNWGSVSSNQSKKTSKSSSSSPNSQIETYDVASISGSVISSHSSHNYQVLHMYNKLADDISTSGTVSSRVSDMSSVSVSSTRALLSKSKK